MCPTPLLNLTFSAKESSKGGSVLIAEVIREDLAHRRRTLGYDEARDLERLLIEQVILTWLHYYRMQYSSY